MSLTFGEKVIAYNKQLDFTDELPEGFYVLNPYFDNPETLVVMQQFYRKYYHDHRVRKLLIGINPSRNGAGVTGVPFTDTKRLESVCGIPMTSAHTHEISSVFMYDMIEAFGGATSFYGHFYINSPFPLAIVKKSSQGNWVNSNYYEDKQLFYSLKNFIIQSLKAHINMGIDTTEAFVLGKKNARYIHLINQKEKLFKKLTVLEHPRYIQQYKSKEKQLYIDSYLQTLSS